MDALPLIISETRGGLWNQTLPAVRWKKVRSQLSALLWLRFKRQGQPCGFPSCRWVTVGPLMSESNAHLQRTGVGSLDSPAGMKTPRPENSRALVIKMDTWSRMIGFLWNLTQRDVFQKNKTDYSKVRRIILNMLTILHQQSVFLLETRVGIWQHFFYKIWIQYQRAHRRRRVI